MSHNANGFQKVFDSRNRRVRGLWVRNGTYYAQLCLTPGGATTKVPLHQATTVSQAITGMQALRKKRNDGELELQKKRGVPRFCLMADTYIEMLAKLQRKHVDTISREKSCLNALKAYFEKHGDKLVNQITMADATNYALWRKDNPSKKAMDTVSGRQIDLDIIAFRHVMDYAKEQGHVKTNPIGKWSKLAQDPKEIRLLSTLEVDLQIETARKEIKCGDVFSNYLAVLASSGGRYRETLRLRWSVNVDWTNRRLGFGQDGLSKFKKKRWVQFNPRLEGILKTMFEARKPDCDWLFPSYYHLGQPIKCFKGALEALKALLKIEDRLGFHHYRHYFISVCCMSGVDLLTIADWVGHEDVDLIARIYAHLCDEHKIKQATKVNFDTAANTEPAIENQAAA
jgi:integrase